MVREEAKEELADDDARKGNVGDIRDGRGVCVDGTVLVSECGVDGTNDLTWLSGP